MPTQADVSANDRPGSNGVTNQKAGSGSGATNEKSVVGEAGKRKNDCDTQHDTERSVLFISQFSYCSKITVEGDPSFWNFHAFSQR